MRKVLIVVYHFPPVQASGVYRVLKFVKYLRRFDWEPIVLTVDLVDGYGKDQALVGDIPGDVAVERTVQLDFQRLSAVAKRCVGPRRSSGGRRSGSAADRPPAAGRNAGGKERTPSNLAGHLPVFIRDVFFVPDDAVPWLPVGLSRAVRTIREEGVDVMLTTSPPPSVHIVGLLAKVMTGVPWVVDFRDLWVDTFDFYPKRFGRWRKPAEAWMERQVVRLADRIVNISRGESGELRRRYAELPAGKFHVIHNGFDREDFPASAQRPRQPTSGPLTVTHVGTLYPSTADEYLTAVEDLFRRQPRLAERFEFRFVGHVAPEYVDRLTTCRFRERVRLEGPLPHREALQAMLDSDALLLLQGGGKMGPGEIPGKLFEYMASGRPIIAVAGPGDAASILEQSGAAFVLRPDDAAGIERTMSELLLAGESGESPLRPDPVFIDNYSRVRLCAKLADLLDGLAEQNRLAGA